GKALATTREAKFIETSSGIQHNVDELLVGILKQIRLKESRVKKQAKKKSEAKPAKLASSRTHISLSIARELLQKICINDISKSKSCENLHVL
ncbi:Rgk2t, partial [Operophtera brumata]